MNILFGIFYLLFGAAWTYLAVSAGNIGVVAAFLAGVNFFAAWGKFFGGGLALRIIHVGQGSLIVLIWVAAMIDLALHLTGYLHWVDTGGIMGYLEIFIGGILLPPVIAYFIEFGGWLVQLRRRARTGTSSVATNAPAQSTVATNRQGVPARDGRNGAPQRFHVAVGSVTLFVWACCWYFLVLNYFTFVKAFGPISPGVVQLVAYILTIPVVLYVVAYVQSRWRLRSASPRDATREVTEVEATPHQDEQVAVRPANRTMRRVGLVLLVLLIAGVTFRAQLGDDIMCHDGNATACVAVAAKDVKLKLWNESPCHFADSWNYDENERICGEVAQRYVDRGELERAMEIRDDLWKRYKDKLMSTRPNGVDRNWGARIELLIRLHATSRLDAMAEEVCGAGTYQRFYCESLIVALQRAKYVESMDKTSQLACSSSPEPECRLYGNWLISSGRKDAGLEVLRTSCMNGEAHSCASLGFALANGQNHNYSEARWALKRACELKSSACGEMLRVEHQFVSDGEVRADARDVCRRFPAECLAASRIIDTYLRDSGGARQILVQMCEQSPDLKEYPCHQLLANRESLSLVPPPTQLKFSEGGNVSTQIVWSDGVLTLRSVGGFGPQQGKVLMDRRVVPTANAWKVLDAELRAFDVWSWPPLVPTSNTSTDGVAWTFVVTTAARSFSSSGYNTFPAHYREVVAALTKLADGASDAPPLMRKQP